MERAIILHSHIFKNGGTTIDAVLKRNFGASALCCESFEDHFLSQKMILDTAQSEGVKSISSHRIGLPPPKSGVATFIPLVMLREPLDRLGSIYSFYKRQHEDISHECALARRKSFKDFVRILMEAGLDVSFADIQSQFFLASLSPPQYPSKANWDVVREIANSIPCVGVLELFDESLLLWERHLRKFFPEINLAYIRKNVSQDRLEKLETRLDRIIDDLGAELVNLFQERNKFDYKLHDLATYRIQCEMLEITNFQEELAGFRERSASLVRNAPLNERKLVLQQGSGLVSCDNDEGEPFPYLRNGRVINLSKVSPLMVSVDTESLHIVGCGLLDHSSGNQLTLVRHGQKVDVVIVVEAFERIALPIVGITFENSRKEIVFCMNSFVSHTEIAPPQAGRYQAYSFSFVMPPLNSGSYSVCPAFASGTQEEHTVLCHVKDALLFFVPRMILPRMPGVLYVNDFVFDNIK